MHKVIEKDELVRIAADLFRMKGYSATSVDDIARACGLTKGSLYHHFPGKEALALAALGQVRQHYHEHIFGLIDRHDQPGLTELHAFNLAVEDFFARHPHGCLLANLSLEMNAAFEPFKRDITQFFGEWRACYAKVFAQYLTPAAAAARAEDALAGVQGCILMNRIFRNPEPLRRQHARLLAVCMDGGRGQ